jgi:hypothetical protein
VRFPTRGCQKEVIQPTHEVIRELYGTVQNRIASAKYGLDELQQLLSGIGAVTGRREAVPAGGFAPRLQATTRRGGLFRIELLDLVSDPDFWCKAPAGIPSAVRKR